MSKYSTWVCLQMDDIVDANSPEEAFEILADDAINMGTWEWHAIPIEESTDTNDNNDYDYACELKFD